MNPMNLRNTFSILCIFFIQSCNYTDYSNKKNINHPKVETTQSEIFIGKSYYEGDELIDVSVVKTRDILPKNISYSLYIDNKTDDYIFAIEKFIDNKDVAKYTIVDTAILSGNLKQNDILVSSYHLNDTLIVDLRLNGKNYK